MGEKEEILEENLGQVLGEKKKKKEKFSFGIFAGQVVFYLGASMAVSA